MTETTYTTVIDNNKLLHSISNTTTVIVAKTLTVLKIINFSIHILNYILNSTRLPSYHHYSYDSLPSSGVFLGKKYRQLDSAVASDSAIHTVTFITQINSS